MYRDLREFIERVDELKGLRRIDGADPRFEIGGITEVAAGRPDCPALLPRRARKSAGLMDAALGTASKTAMRPLQGKSSGKAHRRVSETRTADAQRQSISVLYGAGC